MTAQPTKRLLFLQKITTEGSSDPFHWYALAMEYRTLERHDDAVQTFTTLRAKRPDYMPMYLMCGQTLEKVGRRDDAREWYQAGVALARAKGEEHARTELEAALGALG